MTHIMNSIEIGLWNQLIPVHKKTRPVAKKTIRKNKRNSVSEIKLTFSDERNKHDLPISINELVLNASPEEELSYEPTRPIPIYASNLLSQDDPTVPTKVATLEYKKGQVLMIFSISFLGLLIGACIALFVL
ncbi:MAG: hypothetical protein WA116_01775 [Anaerolineaceae bacterium]